MNPTAQPRALRFLIAFVCALAAILMGVTSASAAAVPTSATVDICVYDVHHQFVSMTDTVTERGPPGYDPSGTTDNAVDHGSRGTSTRSATAASSPAITTYDRTATLVQIARTTGTIDRVAQATDASLVAFEPSSVAANTGKAIEKWSWPPNRGFLHNPVPTTLKPGTRIDRYGREGGTFVSPQGTPFPKRALPAESANAPYRAYEVVGDLEVRGGITAPWFGQPGGGIQYELPSSVADLISRGILKPVG